MAPKARGAAKEKAKADPKRAAPKARGAKRKAPATEEEQHAFLEKAKQYEFDDAFREMVLSGGPDLVTCQPAGRWSALHQFAHGDNAEAVGFLLEHGADLSAKTSDGKTPREVAKGECVAVLEEAEKEAQGEDEAEEDAEAPEPPKRGAAKAKAAEPEPPKRGAAKAKAKEEPPAKEPPAKRAKAEAKAAADEPSASSKKRNADGELKEAATEPAAANVVGPTGVFFEDGKFSAEYAKSARSKCTKCKETIANGALRLGKSLPSDKFDGYYTAWQHADCFLKGGVLPLSSQLIGGFSTLRPEDQETISEVVPATAAGSNEKKMDPEKEEKLKEQNEKIFDIVDTLSGLSEHHLKEMLALNGYPTQKIGATAAPLIQQAADGILFGAIEKCEVCSDGRLLLCGEGYRCKGRINDFLRCTFKTQLPGRVKWQLTETAKMFADGKLEKMKLKVGKRLFASELKDEDDEEAPASTKKPPFLGLTVIVMGAGDSLSKEKLIELITTNGGSVADAVTKEGLFMVATAEMAEEEGNASVEQAKELKLPGLNDSYISSCVESGDLEDMTPHLLWGEAARTGRREVASKNIEKLGVMMDSDIGKLVETAHVLVDRNKKIVYSEILNKTDIVSGANSFYKLVLLESDDASSRKYWVWRKWGRIGVSQGGTKLEEHHGSQSAAIASFRKLYHYHTGNEYGHTKDEFVPKPGQFVRVDVEHKALSGKKAAGEEAAEGGGDGGGQPLGKLTKAQIEKGDAVLDKMEDTVNSGAAQGSGASKANAMAKLSALSAEYYTLIPHDFGIKKPPVITTEEMLGAEKALLAFYLRMGFEDLDLEEEKLAPISGVMELPVPKSLKDAAGSVCKPADIKGCMTKAGGLHKKKAGSPQKTMNPDLYGAILLYTANAIYKELNKALREEDRSNVEKYFPYLRLLFEACDRLPQKKRTLWRGVGVDLYSQYKVGSTIVWWGVSSCTSEEKVARGFMAGCGAGATLLTVETQTACDISELSFYANEAESILLPGTQLEVISSKKVGNKSEIALLEVGRIVG